MAGKKEIAIKNGEKTRFKKGNTASVGKKGNQYSYRAQLQWVMAQTVDAADLPGSIAKLAGIKAKKGPAPINADRMLAIRAYERTLMKMEPQMFNNLIDQSEGKLSQEIVIPSNDPAPLKFITDEEAEIAYKEFIGK